MVAIFLNTVGHETGNRMIQERYFHEVLVACLRLSIKYIKPSYPRFQNVHRKIRNDQRYWSFYFLNAIGAIDGTYIPCIVSPSEQPNFIRKKMISNTKYNSRVFSGFTNYNEVFNYYYSSLRGTIERMSKFKIKTQVQI
ncbi:hypothetical protein S83_051994, partial [Arachis hypogaea]